MEEVRNNLHCTLPDDPEQSMYRYIIVAAKRARQLQGGARPVLPTTAKKATTIAIEEARRGLVKYYRTDLPDLEIGEDFEVSAEPAL